MTWADHALVHDDVPKIKKKYILKENKQRHRLCYDGTILSYVAFSEDISDDSNTDLTQVQKYEVNI